MSKKQIQTAREKRQAELKQITGAIAKREQELSMLVEAKFKTIGALDQLDELDGQKKKES